MAIELNTDIKPAKRTTPARPKKAAKKAASAPPAITHSVWTGEPFDSDARRAMIAETAYSYAAQRDFAPGHELDDWLAAEAEVDARLCGEAHPF